ncbi:MAG TPA: hypothetical protein VGB53_15035 [Rubricoccaceae bacterium]|jgi:hypothetical protein
MTEPGARDAALIALRPLVPSADPALATTPHEAFLHATLRPVLKLRNDTLLALVADHVRRLVKDFARFAPDDRRERLGALLRADSRLKRTLVGAVLGVLTADELAFVLAHEAEVRRRIVALVAERVAGQADAVAHRVVG